MNGPDGSGSEGESAPAESEAAAVARAEIPSSPPIAPLLGQLRPALFGVLALTVLTGVLFPLLLFAIARPLFPGQTGGSLIVRGRVVGSALIGQEFTGSGYFQARPSSAGKGYDAAASGGSNLGPTNPKLRDGSRDDPATPDVDESFAGVRELAEAFRTRNGMPASEPVPIDAVTRSASGLDPHISPPNAILQASRVSRIRGLSEATVLRLIAEHLESRQFGLFGEPRVNVLSLNMALDQLESAGTLAASR